MRLRESIWEVIKMGRYNMGRFNMGREDAIWEDTIWEDATWEDSTGEDLIWEVRDLTGILMSYVMEIRANICVTGMENKTRHGKSYLTDIGQHGSSVPPTRGIRTRHRKYLTVSDCIMDTVPSFLEVSRRHPPSAASHPARNRRTSGGRPHRGQTAPDALESCITHRDHTGATHACTL